MRTLKAHVMQFIRSKRIPKELRSGYCTQCGSPHDHCRCASALHNRRSRLIARAMMDVAKLGSSFIQAIQQAQREEGMTPLVESAVAILGRLNGRPGDSALEVIAQLPDDIAAVEAFLDRWRGIG